MNERRGFLEAKKASYKSDYGTKKSLHLGAAVFYKGELLATGWNSEKTHPLQFKYNDERIKDDTLLPKMHAEIMAISKIKNLDIDFSKVEIFVYRKNVFGVAMAKPCASCEKCLRDMGIKRVHYTGNNSYVNERYVLDED